MVALLAEGVDRNSKNSTSGALMVIVALLAEGVDRNLIFSAVEALMAAVALLAEGVDRNCTVVVVRGKVCLSPSSRRAWIEMPPDKRESDED